MTNSIVYGKDIQWDISHNTKGKPFQKDTGKERYSIWQNHNIVRQKYIPVGGMKFESKLNSAQLGLAKRH